ncbi:DUF1330 domain-containing protein [Parvularcula oceani]|uniref:DUF1330 domain-containing protein n=1 Tax=Parvularcula oceani TaxID=1247963 RepID=UPI000566B09D|nr:DUF1330 domain-containing protein [Parvularcula oceani]
MSHIDPTREAFHALAEKEIEGPVQMLNLLRFRDFAAYAEGQAPKEKMTGAEAYAEYARVSAAFFKKVGGHMAWSGKPVAGVIGPGDERWDAGFIAEYPSKDAFIGMVKDEGYQAIVHHRQAAVEDSRLYCFAKKDGGGVFG